MNSSIGSVLKLLSVLSINLPIHTDHRTNTTPTIFASLITDTAITQIAAAICRQQSHVIRVLRQTSDPNLAVSSAEQRLLHALHANCTTAPLQILNDSELRTEARKDRQEMCVYVLVLRRVEDFQPHIFDSRMGAKQFQSYFVVIEARIGLESHGAGWLLEMFRVFWLKQILNVVVIFVDDASGEPKWFTYTPFGDRCEGTETAADGQFATSIWYVPHVEETATNGGGGGDHLCTIRVRADAQLFSAGLINVHGSTLLVSMSADEVRAVERVHYDVHGFEGVDGCVADLIRERLNATFRYVRPTRDFTGANTTGVLGDLYYRFANFGFNAQSYVPRIHAGVVEATNSFERHDICILVPNSAAEPTLYNLLHTMTPLTWAIVVASLGLMIVMYKSVQSAQVLLLAAHGNRERCAYSWMETVSVHFQSFFGDSICTLPTSVPLRCMIWCWSLYSFLITTAFTAKLISSLVLPRHLDDIDTLDELGTSPLNVIYPQYLNDTLWHFLATSDGELLANLRDQMRPVPRDQFLALLSTDRTGNAYVMPNYMAKYIRKKHFDVLTGRSYYHLMHECLVYLPKVYLLEKGSAYVGHVNELLGRFNEMGFIVKWEEDTMHMYSVKAGPKATGDVDAVDDGDEQQIAEEDIKVVITVTHLQTAFFLLAVGLAAGMLEFVAEWWNAFWQRRMSLYRVVYFDKKLARAYGCRVDE